MKSSRARSVAVAATVMLFAIATALAQGEEPEREPARQAFTIGIEDQLRILVWGEPDLSLMVTVRPDGKITIPIVNDIVAEGLTPDEVRAEITEKLANFVRNPNVTVIVERINSFKVFFIGEVNTPGALLFLRPTRVLQAVAMAGGPSQFSKKEIVLIREELGVEKRIPIDYKKLLAGEPEQENLFLRPGDTLVFK